MQMMVPFGSYGGLGCDIRALPPDPDSCGEAESRQLGERSALLTMLDGV